MATVCGGGSSANMPTSSAAPLELPNVANAVLTTSAVMLTVGLLACVEPGRRVLWIQPTDALKDA